MTFARARAPNRLHNVCTELLRQRVRRILWLHVCRLHERNLDQLVRAECIVDRLEGACEAIAHKYEYRPIFTIRDFGIQPPAK